MFAMDLEEGQEVDMGQFIDYLLETSFAPFDDIRAIEKWINGREAVVESVTVEHYETMNTDIAVVATDLYTIALPAGMEVAA